MRWPVDFAARVALAGAPPGDASTDRYPDDRLPPRYIPLAVDPRTYLADPLLDAPRAIDDAVVTGATCRVFR
jgi:hypothetical protein